MNTDKIYVLNAMPLLGKRKNFVGSSWMVESTEFQKRVLMTGLIISRSKKSGMLVERKSRNRHPNFLFENDV